MLVGDVVGELELVEGDDLGHPALSGGGTVRMNVHPLRHLRIRLPRDDPTAEKVRDLQITLSRRQTDYSFSVSTSSKWSHCHFYDAHAETDRSLRNVFAKM